MYSNPNEETVSTQIAQSLSEGALRPFVMRSVSDGTILLRFFENHEKPEQPPRSSIASIIIKNSQITAHYAIFGAEADVLFCTKVDLADPDSLSIIRSWMVENGLVS